MYLLHTFSGKCPFLLNALWGQPSWSKWGKYLWFLRTEMATTTLICWRDAVKRDFNILEKLHLGCSSPMQQYVFWGADWMESSSVEKDVGILVGNLLNMSEQCALTMKASCIVGLISKAVASRSMEAGIAPCLALWDCIWRTVSRFGLSATLTYWSESHRRPSRWLGVGAHSIQGEDDKDRFVQFREEEVQRKPYCALQLPDV